jgi:hypothetical protein
MCATGDVYTENRRGPRTEPGGTPVERGITSEEEFPILIICVWFARYEEIQD